MTYLESLPARQDTALAAATGQSVVHVINSLDRGGAEATLFKLVAADCRRHRTHIVSLTDLGEYGKSFLELGVHVTPLKIRANPTAATSIVRLARLLKRIRPSLVQTWLVHSNMIGGIAARLAGIPVCWGIRQADLSIELNGLQTATIAKACAWMSGSVPKYIVSCSERAVRVHQDFGYRGRFEIIPNGFNISDFHTDSDTRFSARASLGIPSAATVLGHVGRFDVHKDYPTLLRACGQLAREGKQFRLVLCGQGLDSENTALRALIANNGLADRVSLLGVQRDVLPVYAALDFFVLSSLSEAFPNVVAEAMAAGVPCIVTDVGDAGKIVGGAGWIVPPRDPAALAFGLAAAMDLPRWEWERVARDAKTRVASLFTVQRMVDAYHRVWARTVHAEVACAA